MKLDDEYPVGHQDNPPAAETDGGTVSGDSLADTDEESNEWKGTSGDPLEKEPRLYQIRTDVVQDKNNRLLTLDEMARGIRLCGGIEYESPTSHSYPNVEMTADQASDLRGKIGAQLDEIYGDLGVAVSERRDRFDDSDEKTEDRSLIELIFGRWRK